MSSSTHSIELIIGEGNGEIINGDVPVRWCIPPETLMQIQETGATDVHILIMSLMDNTSKEMDRQLIPIGELMTYLRFTRSGKSNIVACLIDGGAGRKLLHNTLMQKTYGNYTENVLNWNNVIRSEYDILQSPINIIVDIPEGVFGKEPGKWMKWFVNFWHSDSYRVPDECAYRNRKILAFTLKWIPMTIWYFMLLAWRSTQVFLFASTGFHHVVKWKTAFRPFKYPGDGYVTEDGWLMPNKNSIVKKRELKHIVQVSIVNGTLRSMDTTDSFIWMSTWLLTPLAFIISGVVAAISFNTAIIAYLIALSIFVGIDILVFVMSRFNYMFAKYITLPLHTFRKNQTFRKINKNNIISDGWDNGISVLSAIKFDSNPLTIAVSVAAVGITIGTIITSIIMVGIIPVLKLLGVFTFIVGIMIAMLYTVGTRVTLSVTDNDIEKVGDLLCPVNIAKQRISTNPLSVPIKQKTLRLWYRDVKNKVCKPMQY